MATNKTIGKPVILLFFVLLFLGSCKKEDNSTSYKYFVSKELLLTFDQTYINSLITSASGSLPEISSLVPLVKSGINVYRVVYTTTIDGVKTDVSGLVCVPATGGEYPVLSFQNGTNTVNANSPGESAISYNYQFIEIIASMGYIVVIPDYPGFGESSQIPHPYLVKEPTVRSLVDMLYSVRELVPGELKDISVKNEYYLLGYSQGGWATLALHKALESDYSNDFILRGSVCGAGPYNIFQLLQGILSKTTYPMPVYTGYILNAYKAYNQFTNPVTDIFNEPYSSRLGTLYNGINGPDEINSQLTVSVQELFTPAFRSGYITSPDFASVREALNSNSISGWHTYKPLLLMHGENDTSVNPVSTENMYSAMILAGTSPDICRKVVIPGVDHGEGAAPFIIQGVLFLNSLKDSE